MDNVLKNLHAVPGVIGTLLADTHGTLIAHSFPPLFDAATLQSVCTDITNCLAGLEDATGGVKLLDLRFEHGRLILKQTPAYCLVLLCEQRVNIPLLLININVAANRIGALKEHRTVPDIAASTPKPDQPANDSTNLKKIVESSFSSGMI